MVQPCLPHCGPQVFRHSSPENDRSAYNCMMFLQSPFPVTNSSSSCMCLNAVGLNLQSRGTDAVSITWKYCCRYSSSGVLKLCGGTHLRLPISREFFLVWEKPGFPNPYHRLLQSVFPKLSESFPKSLNVTSHHSVSFPWHSICVADAFGE